MPASTDERRSLVFAAWFHWHPVGLDAYQHRRLLVPVAPVNGPWQLVGSGKPVPLRDWRGLCDSMLNQS